MKNSVCVVCKYSAVCLLGGVDWVRECLKCGRVYGRFVFHRGKALPELYLKRNCPAAQGAPRAVCFSCGSEGWERTWMTK